MSDRVITNRKGGRPRVSEPQTAISAWIPAKYHDRLARIAIRNDVSVSAVVKNAIVLFLKDDSSGPRR